MEGTWSSLLQPCDPFPGQAVMETSRQQREARSSSVVTAGRTRSLGDGRGQEKSTERCSPALDLDEDG